MWYSFRFIGRDHRGHYISREVHARTLEDARELFYFVNEGATIESVTRRKL